TKHVVALPPFVLGLKVPRYLERATEVAPEVIVVGPDGNCTKDTAVKVRLLNRQWHSHLRASDFSNGVARYVTDVVDEKVSETTVTSGEEPTTLHLPLDHAGVYVVELEAHDRLGRAQVIGVDLYAGGAEPVTWAKPATRVFEVATDKEAYDPGETAALVLKSPFQEGRALAVTEAPEGNAYQWLEVKGGSATLKVPVQGTYAPKLPVHFVLMRGRVPGAAATPKGQTDLGRPSTVAATAWVKVNPVDNRVDVTLENPPKARPGDTIPVTIRLRDPRKKPLAGEVTLWLVDQAVLALGKEQRLDPIPDFLVEPRSRLTVRDTRGLVFGHLPFAEPPGCSGDAVRAAGVGRIVEGEGGPGKAQVAAEGAAIAGPTTREIAWAPDRPERIEFPVEVATPPYTAEGKLSREEVTFKVAVERLSDGLGDAFEVKLPIRDDRQRVTTRVLKELRAGAPVALPAVPEAARAGTVRR